MEEDIIVYVRGGVVQNVVSKKLLRLKLAVIDYDVDSIENPEEDFVKEVYEL
jgi:hypothetical protein